MMHLVRLIENEDYDKVKELVIKNGIPKNSEWGDYLLLRFAVCKGHYDIIKFLIERGCRVNKNVRGPLNTLLHIAVKSEFTDIVKLLLDYGAAIDRKNDVGETPLTLAARSKNEYIIDLILKVNFEENYDTLEQFHVACIKNHVHIVAEFIRLGSAPINKQVSTQAGFWPECTPLHLAVDCGHDEIVELLLRAGADLNLKNWYGKTALHIAMDLGNDRIIKIIFDAIEERSLYENTEDNNYFSHFHISCMKDEVNVAKGFLEHGADADDRISLYSECYPRYTPLHLAVQFNSVQIVKLLLDSGANLGVKNKKGLTPLQLAVHGMKVRIIEMIATSQTTNKIYDCGFSHMHALCMIDGKDTVQEFLKQGEDVNLTVKAHSPMWRLYTPLHFALVYKCESTVKLLLKHGGNIDPRLDTTVLHLAAEYMAGVVGILLKNGAAVNVYNQAGMTPLHVATKYRKQRVISKLIAYKADIDCAEKHSLATPLHLAVVNNFSEIVNLLIEHNADLNKRNRHGQTPLHIAIQQMNKQMIDELITLQIERGNITNPVDNFGFSYLHAACITNKLEYVEALLEKGEYVNQSVSPDSPAWSLCTPLYFAMLNNSESTVRLLLDRGAGVSPASGMTALHLAVQYMSFQIVDKLLAEGAQVNTGNRSGLSPLHMAVDRGELKMVKRLLEYKADINWVEDYERRTPLHFAARSGDIEIVRLLLKKGANVKAITAENCLTALHLMTHPRAQKGFDKKMADTYSKIITAIVDAGCDINVRDGHGFTPIYYASIYKCCSSVYAFLQNGADLNIKNMVGEYVISSYIKSGSEELNEVFRLHEEKMRILDLFKKNEEPTLEGSVEDIAFMRQCVDELNRMQDTRFSRYSSLYSMMFMNPFAMASYLLNGLFKKVVESDEFEKSFPLYGYFVKLQFHRSTLVEPFLKSATDSLELVAEVGLPDYCCKTVFKNLNVRDLENLIIATDKDKYTKWFNALYVDPFDDYE